jgi:NitT/TauT family transport system substrate-binding protein
MPRKVTFSLPRTRQWSVLAQGVLLSVVALAVASAATAQERAATLKKASYLPHWVPQAQFAGYYVAAEKGLYRQRGLDITVLRGVPELPSTQALAEGRADFVTTFLSTGLERWDQGVDLVNIAQIVQRSALLLVARASSGIKTPADLNGRTVSIWPEFRLQPQALFRKLGVSPRVINQRNTLNLFLRGGADAASAMLYNEYHLLLNSGLDEDELVVFRYDAYDLNFPEDGIYCLRSTLERDPAMARGFVQASLDGWRWAFEHQEEALDIVMRHVEAAGLPTSRVHHRWMLSRMWELMAPDGNMQALGRLNEADFANVARELLTSGLVTRTPDVRSFHVDCTH